MLIKSLLFCCICYATLDASTGTQLPPQREKLKPFSPEAKSLTPGSIYQHYSGKQYRIISVGRNSETLEESVVYQALYGEHDVWIRPLQMFLESVVIDGQTISRFKQVQD